MLETNSNIIVRSSDANLNCNIWICSSFVEENQDPDVVNIKKELTRSVERGSDSYVQWISHLREPIAEIRDHQARRLFVACRNYLIVCIFGK